ncbi:MAG TPA: hypothetical protein VEJ19_07185 [Nitrososphaerales archaeon]|nr:hypothetical protein [Nitrososphaerales archaeon]
MKLLRVIIVVVVVVVIIVAALYALGVFSGPGPTCTTTWQCAAGYPLQVGGGYAVAGQQCVNSTSSFYCIGGLDANGGPRDEVYYSSPVSSTTQNVTSWTLNTDSYPQYIDGQSCVLSSGYVYCVGGSYDSGGDDIASSYFAPLSQAGAIGNWSSTTQYPIPIDTQSCVTASSYIYCIGGENETDGSATDVAVTNSVWYAPLSPSGIGSWVHTTAYPSDVYYPSCYAANNYVYCLGGADSNENSLTNVYYATLSSSGVGPWASTTSYPVAASGQACVISSDNIYCVGGETAPGSSSTAPSYTNAVYYASLSAGGIGDWKSAPSFPYSTWTTCLTSTGNVYCFGGFDSSSVGEDNLVHYASLTSLTT